MQTRASNGQSLDYQYDGAGQLIRIQDNYLGQTSTYTYDLAGNRITERVTQKTTLASGEVADVVYQDNKLFYDGQNRLYYAIDGRAEVRIAYDRSGNRSTVETRVLTELADKGQPSGIKETLNASTVTYTYDSMNRQLSSTKRETVKTGTGTLLESHVYTYDLAGNRRSDAAYVKGGGANGADTGGTYIYTYDDLHRLVQSQRGTDELFQYYYDGAGRTVASRSVLYGRTGGYDEYRYNQYDATGHLQNSKVVNRDPNNRTVQNYSSVAYHNTGTTTGLGYDAAGNLLGYRQVGDDGKGTVTTYTYKRVNGGYAQDSATTLKDGQNAAQAAKTQTWYDANGFIGNIVQPTADDDVTKVDYSKRFNRAFVNDAQGNVLYVNQGAAQKGRIENPNGGYIGGWVGDSLNQGNIQRQMVVGGEVLARYGSAPDSEKPLTAGNAPNYVSTAEFYVGASPMQLKGANLSPVSYTVAGGETLKDIARNVLGDASLWWRIAEANALALGGDTQLAVGQTLTVPKVALNANSADTLQPYEPGKVIGSQDPVLPVPAAKGGGCGGLGKIIVLVVAVVVAAVTQQWWLVNMAANPYVGGAVAASAVGAAAGSVASQLVGMAIGEQDSFSWKSVGLAALSAGITGGLSDPQMLGGQGLGMTIARAATANALTQGIGVVTGLQKSFDWKGVAGAAAGAAVGWGLNEALGVTVGGERNLNANASNQAFFGMGAAGAVLRGTLSGLGAGTAAAVARGGKVAIQQVATDAFGNALGGALLDYANSPTPSAATSMGRPASIGANGEQRFGVMGLEPDPISQAYDYSQRNPNSGIRFSDAVEYFGAKESAQYLPSLIPDSQLVGRGKTTEGLDYYDWDSGSRATQTLLKSVQGVPLPAWEDTQVSALPSRESTRSYYQDIEDNASNPATAVLARLARVAAEGFHDNIDSFNSLVHLAQDDKARRMAMAQGLYAIANPGETAKSAASGAANYVRTLSFEKAGEDGLRFLSGAALSAGLSAGVSKGASMVGSLASDALVLDRVAGKVGDVAEKVANNATAPTRIAELQGKWGHLSSSERTALLQVKAEANAFRRLQEMESTTPKAHYLERHGAQLDLQSQFDRAAYGINPTTGAQQFTPPAATRFLSHRDQLNAINRAESIYRATGDISLAQRPFKFDSVIGSGYQRGSMNYGTQYSGQVYLNSAGKAVSAFPVWGQ